MKCYQPEIQLCEALIHTSSSSSFREGEHFVQGLAWWGYVLSLRTVWATSLYWLMNSDIVRNKMKKKSSLQSVAALWLHLMLRCISLKVKVWTFIWSSAWIYYYFSFSNPPADNQINVAQERRATCHCCDNLSRKARQETDNKTWVAKLRKNWTRVKLSASLDTRAAWPDGRCKPPQLDGDAKVDGDARGQVPAEPHWLVPWQWGGRCGLGTRAVPHLPPGVIKGAAMLCSHPFVLWE